MIEIKNSRVDIYSFDHEVSMITASIKDQSLSTLKALGRGKYITQGDSTHLRYDLPNSVTVFLETEEETT